MLIIKYFILRHLRENLKVLPQVPLDISKRLLDRKDLLYQQGREKQYLLMLIRLDSLQDSLVLFLLLIHPGLLYLLIFQLLYQNSRLKLKNFNSLHLTMIKLEKAQLELKEKDLEGILENRDYRELQKLTQKGVQDFKLRKHIEMLDRHLIYMEHHSIKNLSQGQLIKLSRICIIDCLTREDMTLLKLSEIENFLINNLKRKRKHHGMIEELLDAKMVVLQILLK